PITYERRGVASPRWSPSGDRLAFLANGTSERDAKRQIWVVSMSGGDPRRITDAKQGVQQFAWSPDGAQIAFVSADEPVPNEDKNNKSFEIVDDDFQVHEAVAPSHVWVIGANGGSARRVTSGSWSLPIAHPPGPAPSPLSWSPDGKTLAVTQRANPHEKTPNISRVVLVDVASGNVRRLTTHDLDESQPVFSPDGTMIAYWHSHNGERENQNAIWVAPANGGNGREVTGSMDRNVFRAVWFPDSKSFLTGAHEGTSSGYWRVFADGSKASRLDLGDVEPTEPFWIDASISQNGKIAFTGSTSMHPRELYVMDSADSKPRQLTNLNQEIASLELGRSETINWTNEGFNEDGVLVYPPDFDPSKKYPLVVYIHGGPRAATTMSFAMLPQVFAAHDWVVFQPNYRGSDNLGNKYTTAIANDSGAGPGRDVMAGIDAVKKKGFVDADRMAVGGWSYGGYMTSWMIGHYPIFKAAVSGAAVNNLVDQYVLGDGGLGRRMTWGSPYGSEASLKKYIDQSPITYVKNVKTPTLIMSDTGDVRVPIVQSFEMYRALSDNGVPVKFIAYPVSGHGPSDPVHQADVYRRYVDWFSQYLK
ncbi:MAG TPA: S9 family peptidase, partial [Thermoanaerobaculia bacterium]|nr:S9 family peptidase [Thermoanaerobaculia bacterium]